MKRFLISATATLSRESGTRRTLLRNGASGMNPPKKKRLARNALDANGRPANTEAEVSEPAIRASAQLQLSNDRGKVIRRDLAQRVNRIRSQVFWRYIESKIRLPKDFVTRPPEPGTSASNTCKVGVIQIYCRKTMI